MLRADPPLPKEERLGVVSDTPLYDLPGLDVIWDLCPECFHLLAEGISKDKIKRMFIKRKGKYAVYLLALMSAAYQNMTVFSETARKTQKILPAQLKGSELTVITLSVFLCLAAELMDDTLEDRKDYKLANEW